MTKVHFNSPGVWTTDATFRTFGAALNAAIASTGLVQTADTGQINWTTVLKPTNGSVIGYEIWRFDDSLQGTAPVFIKFTWTGLAQETSGPSNAFRWDYIAGTGSNGTGTITGTSTTQGSCSTWTGLNGSNPNTAAWNAKLCHTEGSFSAISSGMAGEVTGNHCFMFSACRSIDDSGNPTTEGLYLWCGSSSSRVGASKMLNFNTATAYDTLVTSNAAQPGTLVNYNTPNINYVVPHYLTIPHPVLVDGVASVSNLFAHGTEFDMSVAPGGTNKHYIILQPMAYNTKGTDQVSVGATLYGGLAILWE